MTSIIDKSIVLYRDEEGEVQRFNTLWEAYEGFKEIRKCDIRERMGIEAKEYYWIFEVTYDDNTFSEREIKFYVRKGKMYWKFI